MVVKNCFDILVGVVLVGVVGWLCLSVIELKIDVAKNNLRLESIKQEIERLDMDHVSKEIFDIEIKSIERDIERLNIFSQKSLEERINVIEDQLSIIPTKTE